MTQEALKLSQEALAGLKDVEKQVRELVAENKALKKALAQTQEPVAKYNDIVSDGGLDPRNTTPPQRTEPVALEAVYETIIQWDEGGGKRSRRELARRIVALYTSPPPQRTWVGLTEQEHTDIAVECGCMSADWVFYGAAVERKIKEKNT